MTIITLERSRDHRGASIVRTAPPGPPREPHPSPHRVPTLRAQVAFWLMARSVRSHLAGDRDAWADDHAGVAGGTGIHPAPRAHRGTWWTMAGPVVAQDGRPWAPPASPPPWSPWPPTAVRRTRPCMRATGADVGRR